MISPRIRVRRSSGLLAVGLMALGFVARADVLVGINGERFAGKVIQQTPEVVVFDSDELELLSLNLKYVRKIHIARPMFTKCEGPEQIYGAVLLSNDLVEVTGPEQLSLTQDQPPASPPKASEKLPFGQASSRWAPVCSLAIPRCCLWFCSFWPRSGC